MKIPLCEDEEKEIHSYELVLCKDEKEVEHHSFPNSEKDSDNILGLFSIFAAVEVDCIFREALIHWIEDNLVYRLNDARAKDAPFKFEIKNRKALVIK